MQGYKLYTYLTVQIKKDQFFESMGILFCHGDWLQHGLYSKGTNDLSRQKKSKFSTLLENIQFLYLGFSWIMTTILEDILLVESMTKL